MNVKSFVWFCCGFIAALLLVALTGDFGACPTAPAAVGGGSSSGVCDKSAALRVLRNVTLSDSERRALGAPKRLWRRPLQLVDWKERTVELARFNARGEQQLKVDDSVLRGGLSEGVISELHHHTFGAPWALGRDIFDAVRQVVQPDDTFLDAGCGSLRTGVHLIAYLNKGRYTGFDIDELSIDAAQRYEVPFHGFAESKAPQLFAGDLEAALARFERDDASFRAMLFFKVFMHLHKTYDDAGRRALLYRVLRRLAPRGHLLCEKPLFSFRELEQQFNLRVRRVIVQPSWFSTERNITLFDLGIRLAPRKYTLEERRAMRLAEEYLTHYKKHQKKNDDDDDDTDNNDNNNDDDDNDNDNDDDDDVDGDADDNGDEDDKKGNSFNSNAKKEKNKNATGNMDMNDNDNGNVNNNDNDDNDDDDSN